MLATGGLVGGFDGDAESECFDLVGEAAGVRRRALEPVGTEIAVRNVAVENVAGGDKDRVLNRLAGPCYVPRRPRRRWNWAPRQVPPWNAPRLRRIGPRWPPTAENPSETGRIYGCRQFRGVPGKRPARLARCAELPNRGMSYADFSDGALRTAPLNPGDAVQQLDLIQTQPHRHAGVSFHVPSTAAP
ncbi:hypothetical protein MSHI_29180 [Mycobacterium shinjukuense]|uniref:Uncharacterized protein n=1 Tax=Mycobacterium shinjukuense TaxID=398694 RepID=A0A7I7MT82_9MYCO|nr:hypothetical protein MSHI_29180 [Mycobacterium shinjukuense]